MNKLALKMVIVLITLAVSFIASAFIVAHYVSSAFGILISALCAGIITYAMASYLKTR